MNWCFPGRWPSWLVQRQQLKIILRHLCDERNPHIAPGFFAGENIARARIQLSRRMRPHKSISHEAFTSPPKTVAARAGGRRQVVGTTFLPCRQTPHNSLAGKIARGPAAATGARLLDARDGDPQIVIIGERDADQALQRVIVKNLPPRKIGK